jgi:hypothetical protein
MRSLSGVLVFLLGLGVASADKPDPKLKKVKRYKCVQGSKKIKQGVKEVETKDFCVVNELVKESPISIITEKDARKDPIYYAVFAEKDYEHFKKQEYKWQCDVEISDGGAKLGSLEWYYLAKEPTTQSGGETEAKEAYKKKKLVVNPQLLSVTAHDAGAPQFCKAKEQTCQYYSEKTKATFGQFKIRISNCKK